jgi:hypothetical protein
LDLFAAPQKIPPAMGRDHVVACQLTVVGDVVAVDVEAMVRAAGYEVTG